MTKIFKKLAIYHNLPSGGGMRMLENIVKRYKDKFDIDIYTIGEKVPKKIHGTRSYFLEIKPWKGFFPRFVWICTVLPFIHMELAKKINHKYDLVLATHDYLTKSPFLLRYLTINFLYLCQEPQREFYEDSAIHTQRLKERMINIIRYPIKLIDEVNVNYAKKIICNSTYSKYILRKVYKKNCEVVYPGVDETMFKPKNNKKEDYLLCVGGLNPTKDQKFLVSSLDSILSKYKLILVGSGRLSYEMELKACTKYPNSLVILNRVSDERLISLYQGALLTCITSHLEPFGLSSIESQACGTTVVAVNEGGVGETIIDNETGYLAKREKQDYLDKVLKAIKNHSLLGASSRKHVLERFTWNRTLRKLDKYLKS